MLTSVTIITLLALLFGLIIGLVAIYFTTDDDPVVEQINAILPQTQCGQCGYPGCRPYAEALANGDDINKCPPGGEAGIKALADLLGKEAIPLDETHGEEKPKQVAVIRDHECIGCTKCIQACPIDAIIGAAKQMHTVIEQECTGCDLCVEPCPVDCIDMIELKPSTSSWQWPKPSSRTDDKVSA